MPASSRHSRTVPSVSETTISITASSGRGTASTRTARSTGSPGFHAANAALSGSSSTMWAKIAPSGSRPVARTISTARVISSPVSIERGWVTVVVIG